MRLSIFMRLDMPCVWMGRVDVCALFLYFFMVDNFFLWMHKGFMNHSEDKFSFIYENLIEIGNCHHR